MRTNELIIHDHATAAAQVGIERVPFDFCDCDCARNFHQMVYQVIYVAVESGIADALSKRNTAPSDN